MTINLPHCNKPTSEAASRRERTISKAKVDRRVLCEHIAKCGARGVTDQEGAAACPSIDPSAYRARRGECWGHGVITDTLGEKRDTESGNKATVYHITAEGLRLLGLPADMWHADQKAVTA